MNRMHKSEEAIKSISNAQNLGFRNISIDLIFGLPDQTIQDWEFNLNTALELGIQHISSYGLTVEEKTVLNHRIQKGEQKPPNEATSARFFEMNMEFFPNHGFEHYEISNFAREGFISKHNSSYWKGEKYLGLGPSAHSFNGITRQWNVKSNAAYIQNMNERAPFFETETLSTIDKINEHIMTGLRTKWGIEKHLIDALDQNAWQNILASSSRFSANELVVHPNTITLTNSGKLKADLITSELFI